MKSLLKASGKVTQKRFREYELRTNVPFLVRADDWSDIARHDKFLLKTILDSINTINVQGVRVRKISVVLQGKKMKVWVQTEKGVRFRDKSGNLTMRVNKVLQLIECWSCSEWTYESRAVEKDQHGKNCALVLAVDVMES